jgi:hypothetical protein
MDLPKPFSRRRQTIEPPAPTNPITGRPYGQPKPERDEQGDAERAAGQLALAQADRPAPVAVGFDPQRSAWRGARH